MPDITVSRRAGLRAALLGCLAVLVAAAGFFPAAARSSEEYVIGEGDVIKISVYDHPDLETTVRVGGSGAISFPLVGTVRVGGMTVSDVAAALEERLADGYLVKPQVSVFLEEFRSRKTTIMGKVHRPGLYELQGQTTFLELLSKAGGLTADAGDRAVIKRQPRFDGSQGEVVVVDLKRLIERGDTSLDVPVQDGDSVFITEAGVFYITGEVKRPDAYRFEEGTTVVKAIMMAGGFTDVAARDRVVIVREEGGREEAVRIGGPDGSLDVPVKRGDSLYVPKAGVFYVTGEVKSAGAYPFEEGTTVLKAVTRAGGFTDEASGGRIRIIRKQGDEEKVLKGVKLDDLVSAGDVVVVPRSFF